jgi:hypothetical protein
MNAIVPAMGRAVSAPLINVCPQTGLVSFNYSGTREEMRARILELKDALIAAAGEPDYPTENILFNGMYARKLFIPKGTLLIGKIHRRACLNIVPEGDISLLTEFGTSRVRAGAVAPSPAGTMKVGYAHEDTVFLNVFRTDKTTLAEIEAEIACTDFAHIKEKST